MMKLRSPRRVRGLKRILAEALEINPDLVQGYLIVGYMADDSCRVAHNTCCIAHAITGVKQALVDHPDLNQVNPVTLLGPDH